MVSGSGCSFKKKREQLGEEEGNEVDEEEEEAEEGADMEETHQGFPFGGSAMARVRNGFPGSFQGNHSEKGWGMTAVIHL